MSEKRISFKNKMNVRTYNRNTGDVVGANTQSNVRNKNSKPSTTRRSVRSVPSNRMANYLPERERLRSFYDSQKKITKEFYEMGIIPTNTFYRQRLKTLRKELNEDLDWYSRKIAADASAAAAASTSAAGEGARGGGSASAGGGGSRRRTRRSRRV